MQLWRHNQFDFVTFRNFEMNSVEINFDNWNRPQFSDGHCPLVDALSAFFGSFFEITVSTAFLNCQKPRLYRDDLSLACIL